MDTAGPAITLRLGNNRALLISSRELAKEYLAAKDRMLAGRPRSAAAKHPGFDFACLERNSQDYNRRRPKMIEMKDMLWRVEGLSVNVMTRMGAEKRLFELHGDDDDEEGQQYRKVAGKLLHLLTVPDIGVFLPFLKCFDLQRHERASKETAEEMDGGAGEEAGWKSLFLGRTAFYAEGRQAAPGSPGGDLHQGHNACKHPLLSLSRRKCGDDVYRACLGAFPANEQPPRAEEGASRVRPASRPGQGGPPSHRRRDPVSIPGGSHLRAPRGDRRLHGGRLPRASWDTCPGERVEDTSRAEPVVGYFGVPTSNQRDSWEKGMQPERFAFSLHKLKPLHHLITPWLSATACLRGSD
ncbi:hypothetical protein ACLOJK_039662 [Asimina triloba]